ncbi:MAG: hypothetical protein HRU69_00450 [Flammeovirgaceae bacterium]|nr:MAG: hypothetical protein HRU69_00450 [Flammeovirgaceae bacterium]
MKKLLALTMLVAGVAVISPAQTPPPTEYTIQLSQSKLTVKPGETKSVVLALNRSKRFSGYKAQLAITSVLPTGLNARFDPAEGRINSSTIYLEASNELKPGQYQLTVRCDLGRKLKATVLTVVVAENTSEVATN